MVITVEFLTNEIRALEQELETARIVAIKAQALIDAYKILIEPEEPLT
jgi:hypothetical protein